jgi:hypothetical protein
MLKGNKVRRGIKKMNKYAHQRTALAVTPDDGPLLPKQVVVE